MIFILTGLSLLFVAIGFIVTEKNAKYLLSGYNTMGDEERKKVDIKAFILYFRRFHIFLGISFFILGIVLTYFINENAGGIFLAVYPILAYIYFLWTSKRYSKGLYATMNKIGVFMLFGVLILVIGLLGSGSKENEMIINPQFIEIKGMYGEVISYDQIQSIELVPQKPIIVWKTNGFALGTIQKGYFKTDKGEIVKLMLNSDRKPLILITISNGGKIYYSAKDKPNELLIVEMKKTLPDSLIWPY